MTLDFDVRDAIAVTGMFGRFPGAPDVAALWRVLCDAQWTPRTFSPRADPRYVPVAGVLEDIERFDAERFAMTPAEAALTDPQQRALLECCHGALQDAAVPARLRNVGVFASVDTNTYLLHGVLDSALRTTLGDFATVIGNDKDFAATRVAYALHLQGPAVSVQTACSSSLVAAALACQSLASGDCDAALVAASSIRVPHLQGYRYEEGGVLSRDGRCQPFDHRAAGTVPSSAVAAVVLRRLEDALQDGDPIDAVLHGWATNNDGRARAAFTAPSSEGQARAISMALSLAGTGPERIGVLETHGTATALGDAVEVRGLQQVFGARGVPLLLGAAKGNLGHTGAASGLVGLIKMVLQLRHRHVVPMAGFERLHPQLVGDAGPLQVPLRGQTWPEDGRGPLWGGVSSFGIGGTNAHLVLGPAPELPVRSGRPPLLVLTLSDCARAGGEREVARTTQVVRVEGPWRVALTPRARDEQGWTWTGPARVELADRPLLLLFGGQGGLALTRRAAQAAAVTERALALASSLAPALRQAIEEILLGTRPERAAELWQSTRFAQPALACWQLAHASWLSQHTRIEAVLGHSLGELVAAIHAGML
jgi:phthiocerol/phenolphthiocerol synthesis type-I polyketide synthase E